MKTNHFFFCLFFPLLLCSHCLAGQCTNNLVFNGSFDSPVGIDQTADGWTGFDTPDVNDITSTEPTAGWTWMGEPIPSPNGGAWQNMNDFERIAQTIAVVPGETYAVSFEYAAQGLVNNSSGEVLDGAVGIAVFIDNAPVYTSPPDVTPYTWETACFSFTATTSPLTIQFSASTPNYVALDGMCISSDIRVSRNILGNDTTLCPGSTLLLDASSLTGAYRWQDNSNGPTFRVTAPGRYAVAVTTECLITVDTITVDFADAPAIDLGPDRELCAGDSLLLDATAPGASSYQWQDGSTEPRLLVTSPGRYTVQVGSDCGVLTDAVTIDYVSCDCAVYLPNAFSPNNDGVNDRFFPQSKCSFRGEYELRIFSRWGDLVFTTTDPLAGWAGSLQAEPAPPGIYVYTLRYGFREGQVKTETGEVTLLR